MKQLVVLTVVLASSVFVGNPAARATDSDEPAREHDGLLITGEADPRYAPFDELLITFLRENCVPGAALAVARDGEVVYARGFGLSDLEQRTPVQPDSLFRIASISKPITAVAILQLVEQQKLTLDERVFEVLAIEPHFEGSATTCDPRLEQITIRHLLEHTGGWDRNRSFDPMFQSVRIAESLGQPPPASAQLVARFMMGQPLDFDPGKRYAYSNYGYSLLGRVIEQRSGMAYEEYVRERIFAPLGCTRPHIGHTRTPSAGEVHYYDENEATGPSVFAADVGQQVAQTYGAWYLEAMDSHGGWIASAIDLVRFSVAVHRGTAGGLISDASRDAMFVRPAGLAGYNVLGIPRNSFYGLGWSVRPVGDKGRFNNWHTGSLPGTSTLLVRRHDDWHWAVLFNTRSAPDGVVLSAKIDPLLHQAADRVQ